MHKHSLTHTCGSGEGVRIVPAAHRAAAEHHLVLCQSPGLVGEDVLDLAQVLGDVESPGQERSVGWLVVHVQVPVEEIDLDDLDYLDGYVERHRDDHLPWVNSEAGNH